MKRYALCTIAAALVGCQDKSASSAANQPSAQQQAVAASAGRADSARAFVQRFYDWYLATQANKGSAYDSLLTVRRSLLGDSLLSAFQADVAAQRADTVPEIASLSAEADVFLNSQDPCPRYSARSPRPLGGNRLAVVVAGDCGGLDTQPNLEVELRPTGAGWQIENIKDPTNPSFDLLGALVRYHATEVRPGAHAPAFRTHRVAAPPNGTLQLTSASSREAIAVSAYRDASASK
jgi:hypothetical protein